MQHLGRADPVEHRLARLFHPFLIDRAGQGLARRDSSPEGGEVGTFVHRGEHGPVGGRRGEADGRAVCLDDVDHVRRRGAFQQRCGGTEPQRKDREPAEPEGEGEGRRADEHVVRRDPQHLFRVAIRDDQEVAVEVHRRLRLAGRAGRKSEQGDVVAPRLDGVECDRLAECDAVELGVVVRRSVEADDGLEEAVRLGAGDHFLHQPRIAEGELHLGLVDDLVQFPGPEQRHRVDDDGADLGGGEPAGDHRGVVGRAYQHAVAGQDAVVLDERMGDTVRPVGQFLVGAPATVADERRAVAETSGNHRVGQLDSGVEALRIVETLEPELRPLVGRRQVVSCEGVDVGRGSEHAFPRCWRIANRDRQSTSRPSPSRCPRRPGQRKSGRRPGRGLSQRARRCRRRAQRRGHPVSRQETIRAAWS